MFQGNNHVFLIISLIVLMCLFFFTYKGTKENKLKSIIWQFILAGGVSNIIDRLFRGYVVDFIQMKFFGIFNLADVCIVVGAIIIIFLELKEILNESNRSKSN